MTGEQANTQPEDLIIQTMERDQLRKLAQAATPGVWEAGDAQPWQPGQGPFDDWGASITSLSGVEIVTGGAQDEQGGAVGVLTNENAAYIAAANPQVVLALLDQLEEMDQALTATQELQDLSDSHLAEMASVMNARDAALATVARLSMMLEDLVHSIEDSHCTTNSHGQPVYVMSVNTRALQDAQLWLQEREV